MHLERAACGSRWQPASPVAKGLFALAGLIAAFAAPTPGGALVVAGLLVAMAWLAAGIPVPTYLRAAAAPLLFLALSCLSLAFSLGSADGGGLALTLAPDAGAQLGQVGSRSLAALAALLLLVLTTPLPDLIALLRRLKTPELLLDLTVLGYRMGSVFSAAMHDMLTAQTARLGYATRRQAWHSLAGLGANLAVQVWQRAQALHVAAQARNNDGPLRFMARTFPHARRDSLLALAAGALLILIGQLA